MLSRRVFVVGLPSAFLLPQLVQAAGGEQRLLEFFSGRVTGEGTFREIVRGRTRGVKAVLTGRPGPNTLRLTQTLNFSDGQRESRVWTFILADGRITGRRDDLLGPPDIEIAGDRMNLAYKARTRVDGKTYDLNFSESLAFQSARTASSTMRARLLFVPVAEMNLSLRRA
jgi:hypothetical protein